MDIRTPIYKNKTEFDFMPDWTEDTGHVFDGYRIDWDYNPGPSNYINDNDNSSCYWKYEMEMMDVKAETKYNVEFKKGPYIVIDSFLTVKSYRFSDHPKLFLEFAKLGKSPELNIDKIIKFTNKFGILGTIVTDNDRGIFQQSGFFPLQAFFQYSKEAYFVLSLYEALNNKDTNKVKDIIKMGFSYTFLAPMFLIDVFRAINFWDKPVNIDTKLECYFRWETEYIKALQSEKQDDQSVWSRFVEYVGKDNTVLWELLISGFSSDEIMKLASVTITSVINNRLIDHSPRFKIKSVYPQESNQNKYSFRDKWQHKDLLTWLWFSFALKITGKLEMEYKICEFCQLPIIPREGRKLRKDAKCHDGCRQAASQQKKRDVKKYYEEGKTMQEIIGLTGCEEKDILKWTNKISLGSF